MSGPPVARDRPHMGILDRRLLDPPPAQLAAALGKATRSANGRMTRRLVRYDRPYWERFARRIAGRPEGLREWAGGSDRSTGPAAHVAVAWWTDYLGRRHFRVLGGQVEAWYRSHPVRVLSSWPPLCVLCPERTVLRHPGEAPEVLVLCPCGVCGTPGWIAWMGDRCGACYDRVEEAEPPLAARPNVALPPKQHASWIGGLNFTPDGRALVFLRGGVTWRWDLVTGEQQRFPGGSGDLLFELLLRPDGRRAITVGPGQVLERDLSTGEPTPIARRSGISLLYCAALAPDGKTLLLGGVQSALLDLDEEAPVVRPVAALAGRRLLRAGFVDGRTLLACDWEGNLIRVDLARGRLATLEPGWAPGSRLAPAPRVLAVSPGGRRLATSNIPERPGGGGTSRRVLVWDTPAGAAWHAEARGLVHGLAFTSDGETLAARVGENAVTFWDVPRRREVATLSWRTEPLTAIAFAPDGQTLAASCSRGTVRLLPWKALVESP